MMLRKRIERAFDTMKHRRALKKAEEEEQSLRLEKGDRRAMVLAGLLVVLPIALVALLVMVAIPMLMVR